MSYSNTVNMNGVCIENGSNMEILDTKRTEYGWFKNKEWVEYVWESNHTAYKYNIGNINYSEDIQESIMDNIEKQIATYSNILELHEKIHFEYRFQHDENVLEINFMNTIISIFYNYAIHFDTLNIPMTIIEYNLINNLISIESQRDELIIRINYIKETLGTIENSMSNTQDIINRLSFEKEKN